MVNKKCVNANAGTTTVGTATFPIRSTQWSRCQSDGLGEGERFTNNTNNTTSSCLSGLDGDSTSHLLLILIAVAALGWILFVLVICATAVVAAKRLKGK